MLNHRPQLPYLLLILIPLGLAGIVAGIIAVWTFSSSGSPAPIALTLGLFTTLGMILTHAWMRGLVRPTLLLLGVSIPLTSAVELLGMHTGFPFGCCYQYGDVHQIMILNQLPLFIPLSWFVLAYSCGLAAVRIVGQSRHSRLRQILLASLGLVLMDLVFEQSSIDMGLWEWTPFGERGPAPISNYLGWGGTGLLLFVICHPFLKAVERSQGPESVGLDLTLFFVGLLSLVVASLAGLLIQELSISPLLGLPGCLFYLGAIFRLLDKSTTKDPIL